MYREAELQVVSYPTGRGRTLVGNDPYSARPWTSWPTQVPPTGQWNREYLSPPVSPGLIKQILRDKKKKLMVPNDAAAELARMDKEDAELGAKLGVTPATLAARFVLDEPARPDSAWEENWNASTGRFRVCGIRGCPSCRVVNAWNSWADQTNRPKTAPMPELRP